MARHLLIMTTALPSKLERAIEQALNVMRDDPKHQLDLPYRLAVYAALGPRADQPDAPDLRGYQRRATLGIAAVRHVLPIWEQLRPNDDTPHRLLTEAERVVRGEVSVEEAKEHSQEYWEAHVHGEDGFAANTFSLTEHDIFYAALSALNTAASDLDFNPDKIDYNWTDEDDYDEGDYPRDASAAAADAYSATNRRTKVQANQGLNTSKCREFWEWWLLEAVPAAWHAFQ